MSEKLWCDIEIDFLKLIYEYKGAVGVDDLLHILESIYELKEDLFKKILERVTQKEYCIIERIRKLDDTEEEVVFVTYKGLVKLSEEKDLSVKKILKNQIAYELKCEGYKTYSDWLDVNRNRLALEAEITRMFTRMFAGVLADMCIILMSPDDENEIKETLQEAIEKTNGRTRKFPELSDSVAYTIIMAIYDKLLSLIGTDKLRDEAETTRNMIASYMPERHAIAIDFI